MVTDNNQLDHGMQLDIIRNLVDRLSECYVYPEIAEQVCDHLMHRLEVGDYAEIVEEDFFAYALTVHMQDISRDEHLWVRWHPERLPGGEPALRKQQTWLSSLHEQAKLANYGLRKVERLPGNVGYLDISCFHKAEWGAETATAAMNYLASARALIIDLRSCKGGYPSMVIHIASYLFGDDPVLLNSIYWRDEDVTQQYWTKPFVQGKKFIDKPVFVLTSPVTFSAGEEFAYDLQALQRATVVGERTGGGAHAGASYRIHPNFEAFIPVGRAINPITRGNWQGSGVVPDIRVSHEDALDVAYRLALEVIPQPG
jgi:hypothetical protein